MSAPEQYSTSQWFRTAHRVAVVAALTATLCFYVWTARTNAGTFPTRMEHEGRDYFNHLTDAFRQGQVSLLFDPAPELLALDDPYDSTKNVAYRVHDLSLYKGNYYLYWGPTPVLTLFAPARLILPGDLSERVAVAAYAFGGLVFSLLLLRWLVNRYLSCARPWMIWFGGMALATSNTMPFILRRPTVYEVAISAGFCFSMASIYFLLTGALTEEPSTARLALGSTCLGLAVGARLSTAGLGLLYVAVMVYLLRRGRLGRRSDMMRLTAAVMGPVAFCGVLLIFYNQVRFGSFTEFGLRYQLNHVKPSVEGFSAMSRSLYYYVFAPPRFDLNFPFFHLPPPPAYPGPLPAGYNFEPTGGVLAASPITLLVMALPVALRREKGRSDQLGMVLFGLVALGGLTLVSLVLVVNGVAMRYAADFTSFLLVAGVMTWIWLTCQSTGVLGRRVLGGAGAVLILVGALVGVAVSFTGNTNGLRAGYPARFESLERATAAFPTVVTWVLGRPVITEVSNPFGVAGAVSYRTVSRSGLSFGVGSTPALIRIVSPNERGAVLRVVVSPASPSSSAGLLLVARLPSGSTEHLVPPEGGLMDLPIQLAGGSNRLELYAKANDIEDGRPLLQIADLRLNAPGAA